MTFLVSQHNTKDTERVCTEHKLVSGRVQQWLLIEETTVWMWTCDEELCSVCLLMRRRRRKVTFSTLLHNDLFDTASFQLCWCNPAFLHQPLFFIIIIITWVLKQHGFWLESEIFHTYFPTLLPIKLEAERGFSLLRCLRLFCALKFTCKSGYSSRPVTIPQDST